MSSMSRMKYPVKSTRGDSSSCLSKNLLQILSDKDALAYFIQFMESCDATNLIKFWLDAETFKILNQNNVEERFTETVISSSVTSNETQQLCDSLRLTSRIEDSCISEQNNAALATAQSTKNHSEDNADSNFVLLKTDNSSVLLHNPARQSIASSLRKVDAVPDLKLSVSSNEVSVNSTNGAECQKDQTCGVTAHGDYVCHSNQIEHIGECDATARNIQVTFTVAGASGTTCRTADLSTGATSASVNDKSLACSSAVEYHMLGSTVQHVETASEALHWNNKTSVASGAEHLESNQLDVSHSSCRTSSVEQSTTSHENVHSSRGIHDLAFTRESLLTDKQKRSGIPDAIVIFTKYLSPDCSHPIMIDERLRAETIRRICREDGSADPQCFTDCQTHVLEFIDSQYFLEFLQSQYYLKYEIDLLTGSELHLNDILYNDTSLCYFTEFMEAENRMNVMQCFMDLDIFEKHLLSQGEGYDGPQAQEDAIVLYDKYFSLQATLTSIKFDDRVRLEVERNICLESGPLPDCFKMPRMMVYAQMEKVDFARFRKSEQFSKYLSDLNKAILTAQNACTTLARRSHTGSDVSSDKSVEGRLTSQGSGNTLLAMDTRGQHMKRPIINQIPQVDMRIDSALFDPDNLWHRPNAGKMKLGHINDLGQFISDFDPEPDKKLQGSFFNKRKEKDEKCSEEIALQTAQRIIEDIFSITQQNHHHRRRDSQDPEHS